MERRISDKLETDALKELNATLTHAVLSTGGGLPLKEENAAELSKLGTVVYLKITPEEVLKRLSGDSSRPLLAGGNPEQNVRTLFHTENRCMKKAQIV